MLRTKWYSMVKKGTRGSELDFHHSRFYPVRMWQMASNRKIQLNRSEWYHSKSTRAG